MKKENKLTIAVAVISAVISIVSLTLVISLSGSVDDRMAVSDASIDKLKQNMKMNNESITSINQSIIEEQMKNIDKLVEKAEDITGSKYTE